MNINERVQLLRKSLNLTQKEFGEKIGLTQTTVTYLEKDGYIINDRNIINICKVYNVSEKWLLYGNGEMFISNDKKLNTFISIYKNLKLSLQQFIVETAKKLLDAQNKL